MSITGNNGGPIRTIQDYGLEVARGNILGSTPFGGVGRIVTAGAVSDQVIWPNGNFLIPDSAGISIDLVSSSVNDDIIGSGIRKVEIHYLDVNLTSQAIIVDLDGTTPVVNAVTGARFIQCFHIHETGTPYQGAVGTIRAYNGAQDYAIIEPDKIRCESSARMVPADKRCIVYGLVGSAVSGAAAASAEVSVVSTEFDAFQYTDQGLFFPYGSVGMQDGSEAFNLPAPLKFNTGTVIAMLTNVDKAAIISGSWFGWLEDVS